MTPKKKRSKSFSFMDIYNSLRQGWEINPRTRVKPNKKKKSRAKSKQEFKKGLREGNL